MKFFINSILFSLFIISHTLADGSQKVQPVFEHYSIESGLSNVTVYSIIQDNAGFLWFGTGNGLNRFDGYEFKTFGYDPEDSTSLSNNSAGNIYKGKDGSIWVGTWGGGLNRFDPVTETAQRFLNDPMDSTTISGTRVQCIFEDSKHRIWAGTYISGLNLLNRKTGRFTHFTHEEGNPKSLANNRIWAITEDSHGYLWIATSRGLDCFDPESGEVIKHYDRSTGLTNSIVRTLYMAANDVLWVGTQNGLSRIDITHNRIRSYLYEDISETQSNRGRINAMLMDRKGLLWLATGYGLVYFNPHSGNYQRFTHDEKKPKSLSDDEVRSVFEDRNGVLWFGTRGRGIEKYNPTHKPFRYLNLTMGPSSESKTNSVLGIAVSRGFLFAGTLDGFVKVNLQTGKQKRFYASVKGQFQDKGMIRTVHICKHDPNKIWIGKNGGISVYNIHNDSFKNYELPYHSPAGMVYKRILSVYPESDRFLWFGDYNAGLNKLNLQTGKIVKQYIHDKNDPQSISFNEIWFILPDSSGNMWIGTGVGLNYFDVQKEMFKKYFFSDKTKHSNAVYCAIRDKSGLFWLGTDYGLIRFNPETGFYKVYSKKEGLQDEQINSILADNEGNLWLGTGNGLTKFNPVNEQATNFGVSDGLSNPFFLSGSAFKAEDGELFFGGSRGIDHFYPEKIKINTTAPPIVLTKFNLLNKTVRSSHTPHLTKAINYTREIVLQHQDYLFSFEFAALDYASPMKNKYAYKLDGIDNDWVYTDAHNRVATYTNLPGGSYTFHVKGSNADGVWNETGLSLKVRIIPPFWQTWTFRIGVFLFSLFLLTIIFRFRTASIKKRSKELEAINTKLTEEIRERKRAEQEKDRLQEQLSQAQKMEALGTLAGGMAHDFNNLLTVISGHSEIALLDQKLPEKHKKHFQAVLESSKRAENLTRQLLALGRKQMIQPQVLNLNETIGKIHKILRRLIPEDIHIEQYLSDSLPLIEADPGQIEQILLNMIINARDAIEASKTLHNERRIILATTLSKASDLEAFGFVPKANTKYVKISISDTGKGMSAEVQEHIFEPFYTTKELNRGTGLGLATVYGIVSQNNGFIHLDSAPEKGSIFHIFWPESTKKISEIKQSEPVQTALSSHHGHILVVEDEAAVRDFTHSALEAIGYRVTIAENGIQALNLLKKENDFDLVLTDLIMPEMNGQELADRMKKLKIEKPVLFVSGYTFDHLQKEGKIEGEINFLKKPFSVQGLANKISAVLNNKHA